MTAAASWSLIGALAFGGFVVSRAVRVTRERREREFEQRAMALHRRYGRGA